MPIKVTVTRSGGLQANLNKYVSDLGVRVEHGLREVAHQLMAESQLLVPRDTEALAESGVVRQEGSGLSTVMIVGYGRHDLHWVGVWSAREQKRVDRYPYEYAVYVHQDTTQAHEAPGQAFFLSTPLVLMTGLHEALERGMR